MRWLCLLALCGSAIAGEYAVLGNGSRLHADRHELEEGKVRLYTGGGYIEMEAGQIQRFEVEPADPPASPGPPAQNQAQGLDGQRAPSPSELADRAADKYGLPRHLVRSVMAAESSFQAQSVSPKGAIGLMQLMPETARELGADPKDPAQNVDAGTRYLRDLLQKYNNGLWHALAAYNAGPGAVDRYRGVPPYRETLNYVKRIDRAFKQGSGSPDGAQQSRRP